MDQSIPVDTPEYSRGKYLVVFHLIGLRLDIVVERFNYHAYSHETIKSDVAIGSLVGSETAQCESSRER